MVSGVATTESIGLVLLSFTHGRFLTGEVIRVLKDIDGEIGDEHCEMCNGVGNDDGR